MIKLMNYFFIYSLPVKLNDWEHSSHAISYEYHFKHFRPKSLIGCYSSGLSREQGAAE
jgi:hypothetical protein